MVAGDQSRRTLVAAGIIVAHAAVLYALATVGPRLQSVAAILPVTVRFVSEAPAKQQWQPPQVKVVSTTIVAKMPDLLLLETPAAEHAITLPTTVSGPQPGESTAAVDPGAPKLIASVEYLREPSPHYPPQSKKLREQGLVVLRVLIDERGVACNIDIESSSGHTRLDHAAKDAVARAAFRPYIENGMPRRALVLIPIEFALNRSTA